MQRADRALAQAQHLGQNLVGMLAELGPRLDGAARGAGEVQRRARRQHRPDPRLIDPLEQRIGGRAEGVFLNQLGMGAEGPPEHAGFREPGADLLQAQRREPGRERGAKLLPHFPAVGLVGEVDVVLSLNPSEGLRESGRLPQRLDVARRHHHQHDPAAVAGGEVAAEGAVHVVADARPLGRR